MVQVTLNCLKFFFLDNVSKSRQVATYLLLPLTPSCRFQTRSLNAGSTWPGWWLCCRKLQPLVLNWSRRWANRRVWVPPSWRTWHSRLAKRCFCSRDVGRGRGYWVFCLPNCKSTSIKTMIWTQKTWILFLCLSNWTPTWTNVIWAIDVCLFLHNSRLLQGHMKF